MAIIVDRPGVKPDCCGRRRAVSSGWSLASSKHFSGNGMQRDRAVAPQLLRGPLPLYSETMIPSRHSAGTRPDFHTCAKRE